MILSYVSVVVVPQSLMVRSVLGEAKAEDLELQEDRWNVADDWNQNLPEMKTANQGSAGCIARYRNLHS